MNFGEKVRELRKAQNISQTALADMLHVSRRTIRRSLSKRTSHRSLSRRDS